MSRLRPHWRKMTWALILWTGLFAWWIIAAATGADCGKETTEAARSGCEAGTGIGIGIVVFLWFLGFVVLSLIWFMSPAEGRPMSPRRAIIELSAIIAVLVALGVVKTWIGFGLAAALLGVGLFVVTLVVALCASAARSDHAIAAARRDALTRAAQERRRLP